MIQILDIIKNQINVQKITLVNGHNNKTRQLKINEFNNFGNYVEINLNIKDGYYELRLNQIKKTSFLIINKCGHQYNINGFKLCFENKSNNIIPIKDKKFVEILKFNLNQLINVKNRYYNLYWDNLHWLAYNYPDNPLESDKNEIIKLITAIKNRGILCPLCTMHFINWSKNNCITQATQSKQKLMDYFWRLHNDVNKRNKKMEYSYNDLLNQYQTAPSYLKNYGVDIIQIFNNKNLENFPNLFNTIGFEKIKGEFKFS